MHLDPADHNLLYPCGVHSLGDGLVECDQPGDQGGEEGTVHDEGLGG